MLKSAIVSIVLLMGVPAVARTHTAAAQAQALEARRAAAENGTPADQYDIAYAYDSGNGVPQDHEKAIIWVQNIGRTRLCGRSILLGHSVDVSTGAVALSGLASSLKVPTFSYTDVGMTPPGHPSMAVARGTDP